MSGRGGVRCLRVLVGVGIASLVFCFGRWLGRGRVTSPGRAVCLALAALDRSFQMLGASFFHLMTLRRPDPPPRPESLRVRHVLQREVNLVRRALACLVQHDWIELATVGAELPSAVTLLAFTLEAEGVSTAGDASAGASS